MFHRRGPTMSMDLSELRSDIVLESSIVRTKILAYNRRSMDLSELGADLQTIEGQICPEFRVPTSIGIVGGPNTAARASCQIRIQFYQSLSSHFLACDVKWWEGQLWV